ncbi:MAG: choline-sulfatase [Burkholderiaceae bacterium]
MFASNAQPNILLIQADQMSVRTMPFYGNRVVRAPAMSKLAELGVVFDSMYCNYPLCVPSRASMLTGKLASSIGCYDNGAELAASVPTIAHHLRSMGYRTCLSGKMHFIGPDQHHGYEERLTTDIYPSDFGWTADWGRLSVGTGEMRVVSEAGPCKRSVQIDFDDEAAFESNRWLYSYARSGVRAPFFLTVSFSHPHDPFSISTEYWNRYTNEEVDMPSLPRATDPHSQRLRTHFGMDDQSITEAHVRNARHAYYGSVSYIDNKVAELMRTVEECGFAGETIVLLTSDHGEFLGERDLWFKRSFFEESVRVPFVVYAPWRWRPRRVPQASSLVDLLPTLLSLAGGNDLDDVFSTEVHGHNLTPLLDGGNAEYDVYSEVMAEATPAPLLMIRRGFFKYVHCELDPPQLFKLNDDPLEQHNLAAVAEHCEIVEQLHEAVAARWDLRTLGHLVRASQLRRKALVACLNRGRVQSWDYQPPSDANTAYYRNTLAFDPHRLFEVASQYGVIAQEGDGYQCGSVSLGFSPMEAIKSIAADLDLANAMVRSIEEAKSFLR